MKKIIIIIIGSVILSISIYSQETGCISGDCTSGFGTYVLTNGDKYVGNWNDGVFNGNGTYNFVTGDKYVGGFINGLMEGDGAFYYADKSKFIGQFKAGVWHGKGKYYDESGNLAQKGIWKSNVYQNDKNNCKTGNCLNGKGKYIFRNDGSYYWSYEGDFVDGEYHGNGLLLYESKGDGFVVIGNTLYYKYEGQFSDGKKSGYGVETDYKKNQVYKGNWVNGYRTGEGKLFDLKGKLFKEGKWQSGRFVD